MDLPEDGVEPLAIVGLAARVPGADDARQFWRNLVDGVESITSFTRAEQLARGAKLSEVDDPSWVNQAPVVDGFDTFDAGLFGLTAREAEVMDPQHRMFLEASHAALLDAGYDPARYPGAVGVYTGTGSQTYLRDNILRNAKISGSPHSAVSISTGNSPNYVATTVSYRLNLTGPSLTVHTACSTSLVALHLACEALRNAECDMALAGGVNLEMPHNIGYMGMDGFTSPDGHCRPFDAAANGTVWGSGAGVVVVKRLADAIADGDTVRALILGNAINNDGAQKAGFTAPSVEGQMAAVAQAVGSAAVDPRTITYVEAHGTGTALGDPIEVAALSAVYGQDTADRGWCALGSVKSNIGHLSQPAGVVGVIKTVLAMEHRLIPPTVNYERANPAIDFATTPFHVASTLAKWETDGVPRRAGVSSFGIGGTNAHVILQEAPEPTLRTPRPRRSRVLRVSARTASALDNAVEQLAEHLTTATDDLADVAYTLEAGRPEYPHRTAVVATDLAEAVTALRAKRRPTGLAGEAVPPVAFLFSGQGAQYAGMGARLYAEEPEYARVVDECASVLEPLLGLDLRDLILGRDPEAEAKLAETRFTQPALFVVEYALAALWQSHGVRPAAMIGHSIGEYVAATLAGVFTLSDALRVVAARGRLMQSMPAGSMLAVTSDESEVAGHLPDGVTVAVVNGPGTCVVAGPPDAVAAFAEQWPEKTKLLRTSHAFHSPMMDPILDEFARVVAAVPLGRPRMRFLSDVTGTWITDEQATDPVYWAAHLRRPVRFGDCVATLLAEGPWSLVECGPGRQLTGLARMQVGRAAPEQRALMPLASLPGPGEPSGDSAVLPGSLATLWTRGTAVRTPALEAPMRVPLPVYPFERKRYWVDPDPEQPAAFNAAVAAPTGPREPADWFSVPTWRQAAPVPSLPPTGRYVAFVDGPRGDALAAELRAVGAEVVEVRPGPDFGPAPWGFQLRPGEADDYTALVEALPEPGRIVHAWALDGDPAGTDVHDAWVAQDRGFFSVLHLAQALAAAGLGAGDEGAGPLRLDLVASGIGDVAGGDLVRPEHATLAGLARVLPAELPGLAVRLIDVDPAAVRAAAPGAAALIAELGRPGPDEVTLRGRRRWTTEYEPVRIEDAGERVLRTNGRYLITGGLGGIGITLAEEFASRVRARLVLLTRSGLPERATWENHLATHGSDPADRVGRAIAAIRRMEAAGAEVLVVAADVTDPAALQEVSARIEAEFGGLDGIVHAAGLPGGGMAEVKEKAEAVRVMDPKLAGTLALAQVFGAQPMDFVVLCSSITAVAGGVGQVDYCAANAFLDAYARAGTWRAPVTSQNWGGWAEVGMAAETGPPSKPVAHPVLTTVAAGPQQTVVQGLVGAATHWVLDEHRIDGVPVMPGTGHLECARAAVVAAGPPPGPGQAVELTDVVFLEPFAVPAGTVDQYRVELALGDGTFEIASRSRDHVRGSAGWTAVGSAPVLDVAAVIARCRRVDDGPVFGKTANRMVTFGPRWDVLREHHVGDGEELARIEAPAGDVGEWGLHPAMLDVATSFGQGRGEGSYLPLSYGRVVIRGDLPATFYSHLRHRDTTTGDLVVADLSLVDADGREIVAITDFVLRRVDRTAVTGGLDAPQPAAERKRTDQISPADGADAFLRSLGADLGPQVAITTYPVDEIRERTRRPVDTADTAAGPAEPDTAEDGLEAVIARVWRDNLGVDDVGRDDDFFELGGNSLVAVQIIASMRTAVGVRLPMRSLFERPTVAALATLVEQLRAEAETATAAEPAAPTIPRLPRG
ncbi:SDR family NAD(P)-dependent oxidoreductase [Actinoplanes sp. Pm04-4]|uniref:SDR family NAD(P)-dependent oxidoreductase n=1 Tax=Paractinoplanes pyxinae TaxID=2997416 RepID=A0ABT4ATZ8_9ACTN|nr:type I polyketide synthase [Actinoplanes pyxinae]MCY1137657.1 SDR family NAD(P)-dependent oxidoreductase [Actinoplanes pyxinae]